MNMIKTEYYKDLTKMNTFGMKVKARCFMEYDSVADLVDIEFSELSRPVLHIGGGSNMLFTDDFKGTVLHSKINFIEIIGECQSAPVAPSQLSPGPSPYPGVGECHFRTNGTSPHNELPDSESSATASATSSITDRDSHCHFERAERVEESVKPVLVSVGAGVVFDDFCDWAAKEGLWGVENLSYIPGEVGASAVQNIGAYGVEVKDVIRTVYCYDTVEEEFVKFDVSECGYGYRDSIFKNPEIKGRYVVTHVVFALSREPKPRLDYGHLRDAVMSACSECQSAPVAPSQLSPGPSPYPGVGECHFRTNGTSPHNELPDSESSATVSATSSITDRDSHCHFERAERVEKSFNVALTPSLIRKVIIKIRKEKLPEPSVMGSAGSFFKNPVISQEHFARIEAAAKAEYGPDYKVPHYVIKTECHEATGGHGFSNHPHGTPDILNDASTVISSEVEKTVPQQIKVPAAWLIEQCGWKGKRSGGAAVYDKQPLVIVNYTGEAYPEEIIGLEKRIIASVKAKFGVELHPEVEHI